ncbi:MAG TPA: arginine--tRNA ligase, partial [Longimicrobiales bacterium]|nr:arginine--tRNA ligase [Longimicrobiales bacterium]
VRIPGGVMATAALVAQLERIAVRLGVAEGVSVQIERPRNPEHGDFATNLALVLGGRLGRPPREIATQIVDSLDLPQAGLASADIAGPGFINFRIAAGRIQARVAEIIEADRSYGRSNRGNGMRVQVEFVSANPTGPLHVAHGRGAALGDAIAALLEWTGHDVEREFYVNDAGVQIDRLAESLEVRWLELTGTAAAIPEGGYHGEYLRDLARSVDAAMGDRLRALDRPERLRLLRAHATTLLREEQDRDLRDFGVVFDNYYSESRLYQEGRPEETLEELKQRGLTYESDGAVWLRTSTFGDDKDRVLVKSDGTFTYFLPDLAYHRDKARRGFQHVIDVWGADHHGYAPRMQAALSALGMTDFLDVEIVQMVRIVRGGVEVKLSKRAGDIVSLRDLITETGPDVARYFFLMRRSDAQMLFDLDLALDHSEKNPVFKVQYAHARMCSIFRKAGADSRSVAASADLARLTHATEQDLIKQLELFPEVVERAADARAPHVVSDFLETTAGFVNSWYHAGNPSRNPELAVLAPEPALRHARLALAGAVQIVLRNGLELLGLTAPERMEREESA